MVFYLGKLIGSFLGFFAFQMPGALVGLFVGHLFDLGIGRALRFSGPEGLERLQSEFFDCTFLLLGHVAKSDGRVSEEEIQEAENLFSRLRLTPSQREDAIRHFKKGAGQNFNPKTVADRFNQYAGRRRQAQHTLLVFLVGMAIADGTLQSSERKSLHRISGLLGIPSHHLNQLIDMLTAQARFSYRSNSSSSCSAPDEITHAYRALGVSSEIDEKALKRKYRKLMSENHPDKLISQGVPDHLVKLATQRSQDITAAYDIICNHRS